ncbi:hypothetical protein CBL_13282 [Carabus blaptoides fortunei]
MWTGSETFIALRPDCNLIHQSEDSLVPEHFRINNRSHSGCTSITCTGWNKGWRVWCSSTGLEATSSGRRTCWTFKVLTAVGPTGRTDFLTIYFVSFWRATHPGKESNLNLPKTGH